MATAAEERQERRALDAYERTVRTALRPVPTWDEAGRLARDEARERLGLSTGHKGPQGLCAGVPRGGLFAVAAVDANCVKLRTVGITQQRGGNDSVRGTVREFSRRSRSRMQQTCASIPRWQVDQGMLFVTLTYPSEWPGDWERWKRDLKTFWKRVRRKFPRAWWVWKLEPQLRGAPHFHLILGGVGRLALDWVSEAWYEVVGSGDPKHLKAGTQVQAVRSHKGVMSYAAKYAAKGLQELPESWQDGVGRWWGVMGRPNVGIKFGWVRLDQDSYFRLRRDLLGLLRARERQRVKPRAVYRRGARGSPYEGMWLILSDQELHRSLQLVGCHAAEPLTRESWVAPRDVSPVAFTRAARPPHVCGEACGWEERVYGLPW